MLNWFSRQNSQRTGGVTRRSFLRVGALSVGGLSMADLLRLKAEGATGPVAGRSVIMVFLHGGPSHIDMYDMKPRAAVEFRGEFRPVATNVAGMECCELMPRQSRIMDKLAVLRGMKFDNEHSGHTLLTGFSLRIKRPTFGAVVSHLKGRQDGLPPYVSLMKSTDPNVYWSEDPAYCGLAHQPFKPDGPGLDDLRLVADVSQDRLAARKHLLGNLDTVRREIDYRGALAGVDSYTVRALDMLASTKSRDAFDIEKEPQAVRDKYGAGNEDFLRARRLVEAGISVVTVLVASPQWDTHYNNFSTLRQLLPPLDQGIHALVSDLDQHGQLQDVAIVVWGEFGRTPRVNAQAGRDHWPKAGFALLAGGNFKTGQAIGETDARGEESKGLSMTSSHVLTSLYGHMGIDPALSIVDHNGRPTYLLDDREPVPGLV